MMLSLSPVEAVLIVVAAAGTWWAWRNTRESERDVQAVLASGQNGILLLTAQQLRAQQRAWGVVASLMFVITLTSIPEPSPWLRGVRRLACLGVLVAVVVGSGRADRHRRRLLEHAIEIERQANEQRRRSTDA